jgi:hypothetical protein
LDQQKDLTLSGQKGEIANLGFKTNFVNEGFQKQKHLA